MAIDKLEDNGKHKVEIKLIGSKRSDAQNRLYWQWIGILGSDLGYTKLQMHETMVQNLLTPEVVTIQGKTATVWPSTTSLKVGEFAEYLNMIDIFAADELGVVLPKPMDEWNIIMGERNERP